MTFKPFDASEGDEFRALIHKHKISKETEDLLDRVFHVLPLDTKKGDST